MPATRPTGGLGRHAREVIDECDIILEVADARDVEGTRSRKIENLVRRKGKKLVLVVNKIDIARPKKVPRGNVVMMSAKERKGTRKLRELIGALSHGQEKVRVGLVGYANTGKSSIINALGGRAKVSSKAGFTRGKQWIRLTKKIMLFDSPGIIPRHEGEAKLAIKGAYDITKLKDPVGTAMKLIEKIGTKLLKRAYGVEEYADPYEQLEELAGKWLMLKKGAELDLNRAAKKLIQDWQKGKLK